MGRLFALVRLSGVAAALSGVSVDGERRAGRTRVCKRRPERLAQRVAACAWHASPPRAALHCPQLHWSLACSQVLAERRGLQQGVQW